MTTATMTASRSQARPAQAPEPTGPAFEMFIARNPQVNTAKLGYRWADGVALHLSGAVSAPDASGARQVRSSMADSPDRHDGDPITYTVYPVSVKPRLYACDCPDFQHRGGLTGACKHVCAVWSTLYAVCAKRQAEEDAANPVLLPAPVQPQATPAERIAAVVASLAHRNPAALVALLEAVANNDAKGARTAAARITGWPPRTRPTTSATPTAITQLAA
ncbi:MAG: SWIM zinc finger domain-containing protein [Chloroflexi bacterium]|nr:SWIM zinc finger domain-containing protein [Chloroflexota bacterium]